MKKKRKLKYPYKVVFKRIGPFNLKNKNKIIISPISKEVVIKRDVVYATNIRWARVYKYALEVNPWTHDVRIVKR